MQCRSECVAVYYPCRSQTPRTGFRAVLRRIDRNLLNAPWQETGLIQSSAVCVPQAGSSSSGALVENICNLGPFMDNPGFFLKIETEQIMSL